MLNMYLFDTFLFRLVASVSVYSIIIKKNILVLSEAEARVLFMISLSVQTVTLLLVFVCVALWQFSSEVLTCEHLVKWWGKATHTQPTTRIVDILCLQSHYDQYFFVQFLWFVGCLHIRLVVILTHFAMCHWYICMTCFFSTLFPIYIYLMNGSFLLLQDLLYPRETHKNGDSIRLTYCLHTVNHLLK